VLTMSLAQYRRLNRAHRVTWTKSARSSSIFLRKRLPSRSMRRAPRRRLPCLADGACGRVFHAARVERCAPALLVVPRELEIKPLPRHAGGDQADAGPRVQPRLERGDRQLEEREPECGGEKGSAAISSSSGSIARAE
jgi:hypothetical protein